MMDTSDIHSLSTADLADQIGRLDADIKARAEQLDTLKGEFRRRGVNAARGAAFVVTCSTSTSKRLDTTKLRADLGDALAPYEVETETTRILIKAAPQLAEDAA
jgi:hypothetical protein